jgi:hypothetical protein
VTLDDDAAQDIADAAGVDEGDLTRGGIRDKVAQGTDQRVTGEVADLVADAFLTREDVMSSIERSGELPSEREIEGAVNATDGVADEARLRAIEDDVSESVTTVEEVEDAVAQQVEAVEAADRDVTREDVKQAVEGAMSESEVTVGADADEVTGDMAVEVGAPSQSSINRAKAQTVAQSDAVEVSDVVEGSESNEVVNVIRDDNGDAVGVVGRGDAAETVAQETGGEVLSPSDARDDLDVDRGGGGRTVDLRLRGAKVGEVEVDDA